MALRTSARSGEALCSPLTLPAYERIIPAAAERAGLRELAVVPHSFRYGSAAKAISGKILTEKQLVTRMRVLRLESARRYAKAGKLQRQVALIGAQRRIKGEQLMAATERPANPFLELACRIRRTLRSRRKAAGW